MHVQSANSAARVRMLAGIEDIATKEIATKDDNPK